MSWQRLDQAMVNRQLASSRSQADNLIKMGFVCVNGDAATKSGQMVAVTDKISVSSSENYVSRAAYKLEGAATSFNLDFKSKVVLDVGSSTGGFTDFALKHGAKRVIAIDVGTDQMHPSLINNSKIELHEKTDIRDVKLLSDTPDIVLVDVSFISLREILPHIVTLINKKTQVVAMVKPQFEAGRENLNKGVIKNEKMRREIFQDFEAWVKSLFFIAGKADSGVSGSKGNQERFYLLKKL